MNAKAHGHKGTWGTYENKAQSKHLNYSLAQEATILPLGESV